MKLLTSIPAILSLATCSLSLSVFAEKIPQRVMSIDWTQTETLLALGIKPVAATQQSDYHAWVKSPPIPATTPDIGLRTQPNLERLSELKPDRIFISPMFSSLEPQLSRVTTVTNIPLYEKENVSWKTFKEFTRTLGKETGTEPAAEMLIRSAENQFNNLKQQVPSGTPSLLMIQFMDARHVRVFGDNSMYKVAAEQLGLSNAWREKTNLWGFSLVGLDGLMGIRAQIVLIEPLPAGVGQHLTQDQLWQYIVKASGYPLLTIGPVWSFGAIPSTVRFASLLTNELNSEVF